MTFDFKTQLAIGVEGENLVAAFFESRQWLVQDATYEEQRRGIDFWIYVPGNPERTSIEVKTDHVAARTGNAFIELYSVFPRKPGWAYTCQADWLIYLLPQSRLGYVLFPADLKRHTERWLSQYKQTSAANKEYTSVGLKVPLWELEECRNFTINL